MYLARMAFGTDRGVNRQRQKLRDLAEDYLVALVKNGQISRDYLIAWCDGELVAHIQLARPDALALHHHSQWASSGLAAATSAFGKAPQCQLTEDDVPKRFPSWKRASSLYLFTHAFDFKPVVCCGDTATPIPSYLLPISERISEELGSWAGVFRNLDLIWLHSDALEIPAYKELADPGSDLAKRGRDLCARIESATGIPTYYFLVRYWGRNQGEEVRACPECGGKWHTRKIPPKGQPYHRFPFRCKACRLVSHCANNRDDERHARIGEFRERRRPHAD